MKRRLLNVGLPLLLGAILVIAACLIYSIVPGISFPRMPFDAVRWKATASDLSHSSIRMQMVDDFLKAHPPAGKTRGEIVDLLGEPDDTRHFAEYDMVYHLGLERNSFIAIDSEWLVMRVDDNGVVTEALLLRD